MSFHRRRKRRKKGSHTAYHLASKAMTGVRRLERKQEVKFHDIVPTTIATIAAAGDVRSLALIAAGDARANRDGNFISPFFLSMRFHWIGLAASTTEMFRIIIFRDRRNVTAGIPAVLDVLASTNLLSNYNGLNYKRFKILFDNTWTQANDSNIRLNYFFKLNLRLTLKMGFRGVANGDINENGLFMISLGTNTPNLDFSSRLFYHDS